MLVINNLTKKFDKKKIFDNFSYEFSNKGIYAIVGESGVGKTTLLRIISGLDKNYKGSVLGGGIGNVSFSFQEYRLFDQLNAIENIVFSVYDRKTEAEYNSASKLLLQLGFNADDFLLYPSELSGGMKQRISLARAILKDSPILLLDEPTKELDENNSKIVREIIKAESQKRLVILVTHNVSDLDELGATQINIS